MLGIPGDNTYSNYAEANRAFWRQTILPLVQRTTKSLSAWLAPAYSTALTLKPDLDQIEALAPEREALWSRLNAATFLTPEEKRSAAGYGPKPVTKFNPYHDDRGRFTFGPEGSGDLIPVAKPGGGKPPPKPPAAAPPPAPPPKAPEPPKPAPVTPAAAPKPDFLTKKPGAGTITGNVDKLTPAEKTFANELRDLGNNIEIVPTGEGRTPDFKINGKQFELKTVSGIQKTDLDSLSGSISNRILNGRGQSADIIVDARGQPSMTQQAAEKAAIRAYGADAKSGISSVTILTPEGAVIIPRR